MIGAGSINIARMIAFAIVALIGMAVHEFAHAYIAFRMGDTTARDAGRMTLNPFVNINWMGFFMWVFIGFGILGSAPVNERRMRNPRLGGLLAVAAGPVSNLLLAAFVAVLYRLNLFEFSYASPNQIVPTFNQVMTVFFELNLLLFLFNLIPVFPMDGWHILRNLLPPQQAYVLVRYQQESMYIFLGLILLSFVGVPILSWVISPPFGLISRILLGF